MCVALFPVLHSGAGERPTWAHVELEVLGNGADGGEVGGVVEMFFHRLRCDFTQLVLYSFSNTHSVHGDT